MGINSARAALTLPGKSVDLGVPSVTRELHVNRIDNNHRVPRNLEGRIVHAVLPLKQPTDLRCQSTDALCTYNMTIIEAANRQNGWSLLQQLTYSSEIGMSKLAFPFASIMCQWLRVSSSNIVTALRLL